MLNEPGYIFSLNDIQIKKHFPNLIRGQDFEFTSRKTEDYNCVAWALELTDDWIEFIYDEDGNYDINVQKFIQYFESKGFIITDNVNIEVGVIRISIYANQKNDFTHVARQLQNGKWTSKLGDWEDIEHSTLNVLSGNSYGTPFVMMEKRQEK